MTVVHEVLFFLFICLIGVMVFVVLKPLVIQMGLEKAMASPNYASQVTAQLITLSKAAPQDILINYRFSIDKNARYSIDVKNRKVTVCNLVKICSCIDPKDVINKPAVEIKISQADDCHDACSNKKLDFKSSTSSPDICIENPILFDVLFGQSSLVGIYVKKTGSSLSIEPMTGD